MPLLEYTVTSAEEPRPVDWAGGPFQEMRTAIPWTTLAKLPEASDHAPHTRRRSLRTAQQESLILRGKKAHGHLINDGGCFANDEPRLASGRVGLHHGIIGLGIPIFRFQSLNFRLDIPNFRLDIPIFPLANANFRFEN
jgi:hypothetical protein